MTRPGNLSSPNPNNRRPLTKDERKALQQFARLEISLEDLRRCLTDVMEFDIQPRHSWLKPHFIRPEPPIRIKWAQVKHVLDRHYKGEVSDKQLAEWATMLQLNDAFDWEGPDEDNIADTLNGLGFLSEESEDE